MARSFVKEIENLNHSLEDLIQVVKCVGTNTIQNTAHSGEATHNLDVHYDPEWVEKPKDVSAGAGDKVTLKCLADGNPTPSYIWYKGVEGDQVITNSSELSVTVSEEKAEYTCRVTVKNYKEITGKATVLRRGPARILTSETKTLTKARTGYKGVLECSAHGVPPPDLIEWSYDGLSLSSTAKYQITQETKDDTHKSTLTISNVGPADFGFYNCTVTNDLGGAFIPLELRQEDSPLLVQTVMVGLYQKLETACIITIDPFIHDSIIAMSPQPGEPGSGNSHRDHSSAAPPLLEKLAQEQGGGEQREELGGGRGGQ